MKKLMPLALLAGAAWLIWTVILPRIGGGGGGDFFAGGNQQLGATWWNIQEWLRGGGPQRNNPLTGDPIPDATLYPGDPGGWMNA